MHSVTLAARDVKVMDRHALMSTSVRDALTAVTVTPAVITSKVHTSATATEKTDQLAMLTARREFHFRKCLKVRRGNPTVLCNYKKRIRLY